MMFEMKTQGQVSLKVNGGPEDGKVMDQFLYMSVNEEGTLGLGINNMSLYDLLRCHELLSKAINKSLKEFETDEDEEEEEDGN
jgi:hypothetical protein